MDTEKKIEEEVAGVPTEPLDTDRTDETEADLLREKYLLAKDNRTLRKIIAWALLFALGVEIVFLALLITAQGFHHWPFGDRCDRFQLDESTIKVFTTAVIAQTFGLAYIVVRSLFENSKVSKGSKD